MEASDNSEFRCSFIRAGWWRENWQKTILIEVEMIR